MVTGAG